MHHFDNNDYIYLSLLHLGAVEWNKSSKRLLNALQYVVIHENITAGPVKRLYTELADLHNITHIAIERSLRYAIGQLWECSSTECSKLLYHSKEAHRCPSVSEFLFLYSDSFKRGIIQAWVDSLEAEEEPRAVDTDTALDMFTF